MLYKCEITLLVGPIGDIQMKRYAILVYGLVCYAIFLATFLYAIWFVFTKDATPKQRQIVIMGKAVHRRGIVVRVRPAAQHHGAPIL